MNDDLINETKRVYNQYKSIKSTAMKLDMSEQKVRKLLITAGVELESPLTTRIIDMYKSGKTVDDIAKIEKISRKAVIAHLPYIKGPLQKWTDEERSAAKDGKSVPGRTKNAVRIEKFRLKK